MQRARPTALALLLLLPACQKKPVEFTGNPVCIAEGTTHMPAFAKNYMMLGTHRDGHFMMPVHGRLGNGGHFRSAFDNELNFALVACDEGEQLSAPPDWAEQLADGRVPVICPSQVQLFHDTLELDPSPRAEALGYRGWFHFPKLELECMAGEVSYEERVLFSQILAEFIRALDGYGAAHASGLPPSAEALYTEMLEPKLPPDPWGSELRFANTDRAVTLTSAGPDAAFGTEDDIEVLNYGPEGSHSILSWPGLDDPGTGSYADLLERRGIPHSL